MCQAIQKLRQDLVRRNRSHLPKLPPDTNRLFAVLISRMKYRAPVKRVREDQPHFFFGAP